MSGTEDTRTRPADEDLAALEERLGHVFDDRAILERAITHNSWAVEYGTTSNQTLEFLGDAVVDLVISEVLMSSHDDCTEGEMTRMRASLVNSRGLAAVARELDLGRWVRLGRGEARSGGHAKARILADTYEAVIGAIFLDGGYPAARATVIEHLGERARAAEASGHDHKTDLQELAQRIAHRAPSYQVLDVTGPDHQRHYTVEIRLAGEALATGEGPNRKSAEQMAASRAVEVLRRRGVTTDKTAAGDSDE